MKVCQLQESANQGYFGYNKRKKIANLYFHPKDKYLERKFVLRYEDAIDDPATLFNNYFIL